MKSAYVRSSADKGLSSTDSEYNDDQNSLTSSYDITSSSVISNSIDESLVCNNRLDTRELNELLSTASISRDELDSRQISSGDISPLSTIRRNIRSAYPITQSESRVPFSKSVNNLNEHHDFNDNNISSTTINQDVSLSFSKLDQLDQITLNPLATILNSQELLQFATTIVPKHKIYQCTIIRDKKGIDRSFYPTYYMHLQGKHELYLIRS